MSKQDFLSFLEFSNEILSIAIVIIAMSMLLYNISRNVRDRVTRASSILLGSVTLAYLADTFIALDPGQSALETWFRVQWIGVALVPAALFHLSDALLATTGLVSRGRRRWASRLLYAVGASLAISALSTDNIVRNLIKEPVWHMQAGKHFTIYIAYFVVAVSVAFINVIRAWQRCLTTHTRRRMSYLLAVFLAPAWGIFPYSLLFSTLSSGLNTISEGWLWLIFNIANLSVLAMLAFMAYPLSFFGSYQPDRVIKAELLQFILRGPLTGVAIVAVIQSFPHVTTILGVEGQEFMTFAAVGVVLCLQWGITLVMPWLEGKLIYTQDQQQAQLIQEISKRLMTRADAAQLLEGTLAAICDQLRIPTAFIASISNQGTKLEQVIGRLPIEELQAAQNSLETDFSPTSFADANGVLPDHIERHGKFFLWRSFWLIPLRREILASNGNSNEASILGLLGVWARTNTPSLTDEEEMVLEVLVARTVEILSDMRLQTEVLTTLEDLISEPIKRQRMASVNTFGQVAMAKDSQSDDDSIGQSIISDPDFTEMVKDALRSYWGGPKLAESQLLHLGLVDEVATDGNRVQALRQVLIDAIQRLRPEGQQNFTRTDWILYNILEMRFLQGRKVRDVALRLAMSHADFYRKQRIAIEEVARIMTELEHKYIVETSIEEEEITPPEDALVSTDR